MLRFEAVVRPQAAEALCLALAEWGRVEALEAREVLGSGRQPSQPGSEPIIDLMPKALIAGMIEDEDRETLIDTVCTHARSGRPGDGKIWFHPIAGLAE